MPYEKIGKNEPVCIADEVPFEIPESWEWVRFKNLVSYSMGKTPPRKESEYWTEPVYPWVSIADMNADSTILSTKEMVNEYAAEKTFRKRISKAGTLLMSFKLTVQYGYNAPAKQCGRIRMVRISDIHENLVTWTTVPFCDIDELDISTYLLQPNDILFARTGGTVGKSFLVRDVPYEAIYAGYLIRTRYSALLCPQYLKYFMESPLYWQQLKTGTTATAQPNCNGQTLSNMLLPLPPAKEQYRIVEKINRAFAKVK